MSHKWNAAEAERGASNRTSASNCARMRPPIATSLSPDRRRRQARTEGAPGIRRCGGGTGLDRIQDTRPGRDLDDDPVEIHPIIAVYVAEVHAAIDQRRETRLVVILDRRPLVAVVELEPE